MRKLSLAKQLFLIFTLVLLVTTITFNSILSGWLYSIYSDINYTKLEDFTLTTKYILESGVEVEYLANTKDIQFIVWNVEEDLVFYSSNISEELKASADIIYSDIEPILEVEPIYKGMITNNSKFFYKAVKTVDNKHYIFTVTEATSINEMRTQTTIQIMILFLLILTGGGLVTGVWSNLLVTRVGKIASHVKQMPSNSYSISYVDSGIDEVSDLAKSIETMRKQLHDNEETKREILQNLSHDIKTPLAVIKSYAEAITDEVEGPEAGNLIIKQVDTLEHKVKSLLQLNRLNYLEKDKVFEEVKIKNIINRNVESLKYLTDINFKLSLDESIFLGYEENFNTVIQNILSNAIRYANTTIEITLKNSKLTIYNDGKHIDSKFLDARFNPYEKGSEGIFGVGMSIVTKTLDFFNMELEVKNHDVGVSFIIKNRV
ncbi:MAG: HAMP domain-containing sensor histidine kinase [bacterium]